MVDEDGPPDSEIVAIGTAWRCVAAALAIAGLGAGGYAVFEKKVEAGPVALLVIGLIFAIVAMAGVIPWRIKLGDYEVWMRRQRQRETRITNTLFNVVASVDPSKVEVQEAVEELERSVPDVGVAVRSAMRYEATVHAALDVISKKLGVGYESPAVPARGALAPNFAGILRPLDGQPVLVAIKGAADTIGPMWVETFYQGFLDYKDAFDADRVLLVLGRRAQKPIEMQLRKLDGIVLAPYQGERTMGRLEQGVRTALDLPPL